MANAFHMHEWVSCTVLKQSEPFILEAKADGIPAARGVSGGRARHGLAVGKTIQKNEF
jgi:hypothetical protein